ncbi:MAG TPA: hypothetical protein VFA76_01980 [Terriglobales bacterium]|nr:hypothetical protein [Terriglobales bacterium]
MSSAVISAVAVPQPFTAEILTKPAPHPKPARVIQIPTGVTIASRLKLRPDPALVPTGIAELDAQIGGLPRGALTEIFGPTSSGRTSLLLASLAGATRRQEICALVDAGDAFDPQSAVAAGLDLERLLWVRCGSSSQRSGEKCLEQTLKTTDLLLQSGGFGMVVVDLGDIPAQVARRIPLTSWFRFRRAVENTPTVLLVLEQEPYAKTCASLVLRMNAMKTQPLAFSSQHSVTQQSETAADQPAHAQILRGIPVQAEVVHARIQRKPVRSATIAFEARTVWAG